MQAYKKTLERARIRALRKLHNTQEGEDIPDKGMRRSCLDLPGRESIEKEAIGAFLLGKPCPGAIMSMRRVSLRPSDWHGTLYWNFPAYF